MFFFSSIESLQDASLMVTHTMYINVTIERCEHNIAKHQQLG